MGGMHSLFGDDDPFAGLMGGRGMRMGGGGMGADPMNCGPTMSECCYCGTGGGAGGNAGGFGRRRQMPGGTDPMNCGPTST